MRPDCLQFPHAELRTSCAKPQAAAPVHPRAHGAGWVREWQRAAAAPRLEHSGVYGGCAPRTPPRFPCGEVPGLLPGWVAMSLQPSAQTSQPPAQPRGDAGFEQWVSRGHAPPAAARLHAHWSGDGVSVWLALDRRLAPQAPEIALRIRSWMATQGVAVQSLTCNGTLLAQASGIDQEEENRWPSMA